MDTTLPPQPRRLFGFRLRTLIAVAVVITLGGAALGLDLLAEGLVYDTLWQLTGETSPAQQVLGFGQYLARYTRQQPDTEPFAAIQHTNVNPFGVNTFLEQEVELWKREEQVRLIAEAGFGWIRQQFPWEDIEIHARGDFSDRRHMKDPGALRKRNAISAWDKYDTIVALAGQYGVNILARLSAPPGWSQPAGTTNAMTPPADFDDFVHYAEAVATRYQGQIRYFQVWNEPNLYPEWGDQTVNAEAYTDLLCRTYHALKAIDPDIVVLTGALGPTIDLSGRNAYDLLYLQRMYQAGAGACFDILSLQGYGLWSGPTDDRLRQVTINYQRHLWLRDMMVANGDATKPVWISEAGWNPVPNDPAIADLDRYGRVTMDEAAEWAPLAYERAIEDWPWIGVINWWYLKRPADYERGQSWYYFRLLEPDFTPTPVWDALAAYTGDGQPKTLGPGHHGALRGHPTSEQHADGSSTWTFRIKGTRVAVCTETGDDLLAASLDGRRVIIEPTTPGCARLGDRFSPGEHELSVQLSGAAPPASVIVVDDIWRRLLPWLLTGIVAAVFVLVVFARAVYLRLGSSAG